MTITLIDLKAQLAVEGTDDDAMLTRLLAAATAHIQSEIGYALDEEDKHPTGAPADLELAVLMVAAHFYENREAVAAGVSFNTLPMGVESIVANHRRYTFGAIDG